MQNVECYALLGNVTPPGLIEPAIWAAAVATGIDLDNYLFAMRFSRYSFWNGTHTRWQENHCQSSLQQPRIWNANGSSFFLPLHD